MKIGNKETFIGLGIAFILLLALIQGVVGVLSALVIIIFFILPIFLILNNFNLDFFEKIVFSFFISILIVPTLVYYLAFIVGSMRTTAIIVFLVLVAISFIVKKIKTASSASNK